MRYLPSRLLGAIVATLMLGGCTTSSPQFAGIFRQHVYVASDGTAVSLYSFPVTSSSTPVATISGFHVTESIAIDARHLYVLDDVSPAAIIYVFTLPVSSSSSPVATVTTPNGTDSRGIEVDGGNLWVSSLLDSKIYEFTGPFSGSTTPAPAITLTNGVNGPEGLAFDASHNLYAVNNGSTTVVFFNSPQSNGMSASGTMTIPGDSRGIAVDGAGHAYVITDPGNILYFAGPPPFSSAATFTDPAVHTGMTFGAFASVDSTGTLYACDLTNGLFVFDNAQTSFSATSAPSANIPGRCSRAVVGL